MEILNKLYSVFNYSEMLLQGFAYAFLLLSLDVYLL